MSLSRSTCMRGHLLYVNAHTHQQLKRLPVMTKASLSAPAAMSAAGVRMLKKNPDAALAWFATPAEARDGHNATKQSPSASSDRRLAFLPAGQGSGEEGRPHTPPREETRGQAATRGGEVEHAHRVLPSRRPPIFPQRPQPWARQPARSRRPSRARASLRPSGAASPPAPRHAAGGE
jgi:hypothetical protein